MVLNRLENELKRVYLIPIENERDPKAVEPPLNVSRKSAAINFPRVKMIADFIKDSKPQNVVVELCDERFNTFFNDVMKHPKYEMLIDKFYQVLHNEEKAKLLSEKSNLIDVKGLEYLIAIDFCSYRMLR